MKHTPQQIEEKFNLLPDDIKEAISSVDTTNLILKIGEERKLHIDQIGDLVDETGLVMLGLTRPEEFVKSIRERLDVSEVMAQQLVDDVDTKVLAKLRNSIKQLFEEKNAVVEEELSVRKVDPYREMSAESDELEREKILREIENPEEIGKPPVIVKEETAPMVEVKPVVIPITTIPTVEIKPVAVNIVEVTKDQVTKGEEIIPFDEDARSLGEVKEVGIMEKKLSEVTKAPIIEEKKVEEKVVPDVTTSKIESSEDPYRELV